LLYEDTTVLGRFALPRLGWWRRAQRARLSTRPLSQNHSKREERLKRQAWLPHRAWSRITRVVLRSVIGAVQYGPATAFSKMAPLCEAQAFRHYRHRIMRLLGTTGTEVVMVVARRGMHRAGTLPATLVPYEGKVQCHVLPAHCGHHLNPIAGCWRAMQDTMGAGRCLHPLSALPAHPPRAHGASRATDLCVPLVAHAASAFAGAA
jgi:hypothetical protein